MIRGHQESCARGGTENVPGIIVPQTVIDELATAEKGKGLQKGIEFMSQAGNEEGAGQLKKLLELIKMKKTNQQK